MNVDFRFFKEEDLFDIVQRSWSLDERREACAKSGSSGAMAPPEALESWVRAFSPGDSQALIRRLSWDGLSKEGVRRCLANTFDPPRARLPEWVDVLSAAHELFHPVERQLAEAGTLPEEKYFPAGKAPPFLEILVPFQRSARRRLDEILRDRRALLSENARVDLERRLLLDLASVSALALQEQFESFRLAVPNAGSPVSKAPGGAVRTLYLAFVRTMLGGGLLPFLKDFSVLARQLCLIVDSWISNMRLLIVRFGRDRREIAHRFSRGVPTGRIERVNAGLSDRHDGGTQVAALKLESGPCIVYKPRNVNLEEVFYGLLGWLAKRGLEPCPPSLGVLARPGYGWMEFVAHESFDEREAVARYYRQAGALVCLSQVLHADDLHAENVVATRRGPVLVDAETFLQPPRAGEGAAPARTGILGSQLLSSPQIDAEGNRYDIGGLRGTGGHVTESRLRFWKHTNTDRMSFEHGQAVARSGDNIVVMNGEIQGPEDYAEELVAGYSQAYRFLLAHRRALLAPDGPLNGFAICSVRILLRPSRLYGVLLSKLREPRYQRSGTVVSFFADSLNRVFNQHRQRPRLWPLAIDEQRALANHDVPRFSICASVAILQSADGETVKGYFTTSGLESAVEHLDRLDEEDLRRQRGELRTALASFRRQAGGPDTGEASTPRRRSPRVFEDPLLVRASAIGDAILRRYEESAGSPWRWLKPADQTGAELSLNCYDGASGIAFFLAHLALLTGRETYRDLALAACEPLGTFPDRGPVAGQALGPGAASGLGGMLFARLATEKALGESVVTKPARTVFEDLGAEPETIEQIDLADGAAGAALGLVALAQEGEGSARLLSRMQKLGERLLAALDRVSANDGPVVPIPPGFAHGISGIAYALSRLYGATHRYEFLRGAHAGYRAEAARLEAAAGGASSLRAGTWCHGIVGMGLARVASWDVLRSEKLHREIEIAVASVGASPPGKIDHLCCGNMGRVDFLVAASRALGRPELRTAARALAEKVVERADRLGGFRLSTVLFPLDPPRGTQRTRTSPYDPGLFRGISGIGYALLRVLDPGRIPCVLAFRMPDDQSARASAGNSTENVTDAARHGAAAREIG